MKGSILVGVLIAAIVALGGIAAYADWGGLSRSAGPAHAEQPATSTQGKLSPQSAELTGTIACLPHRGSGPHTMECAFGLKADSGEYWALTELGAPEAANVGDHVRIVGAPVTTTDRIHATYDIVGTFQVERIEKI